MLGLKERKQKMFSLVLAGVGLLAMTGVASAAALSLSALNPGLLNGGNMSVQVNSGASACINFYNTAPDVCNPGPAAPNDIFTVNAPSDLIFGAIGTNGTTHDFLASNQVGISPPLAGYTGGTSFMTINGIVFDINAILVPNVVACPPGSAPGVCSFGDFVFTQLDFNTSGTACPGGISPCGHVLVGFSANGIGYTGSSSTGSTPYTFAWSSQFTAETTQDLINKATTGAVLDAVSFTASPTSVPEPAGFMLAGLGLLALSALGRRVRRSPRV
jgi:hypothetical protein